MPMTLSTHEATAYGVRLVTAAAVSPSACHAASGDFVGTPACPGAVRPDQFDRISCV